jgi:hypothetical protein
MGLSADGKYALIQDVGAAGSLLWSADNWLFVQHIGAYTGRFRRAFRGSPVAALDRTRTLSAAKAYGGIHKLRTVYCISSGGLRIGRREQVSVDAGGPRLMVGLRARFKEM